MKSTPNNELRDVITHLKVEAGTIAINHGFYEEGFNHAEQIALIHSELSELLEELRRPISKKSDKINTMAADEEAADVILRVLAFSHALNLDLSKAIVEKMAYNKTRPHLHNKLF